MVGHYDSNKPEAIIGAWLKKNGLLDEVYYAARDDKPASCVIRAGIVGAAFEQQVRQAFIREGYAVSPALSTVYDLLIDGTYRVQCKVCSTEIIDIRSRYPTVRNGRTYAYVVGTIDAFAIKRPSYWALVPASVLVDVENPKLHRTKVRDDVIKPFQGWWPTGIISHQKTLFD